MASEPPFSGEFLTGLYPGKGHPPVLVVELPDSKQFQFMCDIVNEESFLRVRRTAAKYRQLELNTVGDAEEVDPAVLDYDVCRLNMRIKIVEPNMQARKEIDNAPFWSMLFVHSPTEFEERDKLSIAVSKETEEILMRCLAKATK